MTATPTILSGSLLPLSVPGAAAKTLDAGSDGFASLLADTGVDAVAPADATAMVAAVPKGDTDPTTDLPAALIATEGEPSMAIALPLVDDVTAALGFLTASDRLTVAVTAEPAVSAGLSSAPPATSPFPAEGVRQSDAVLGTVLPATRQRRAATPQPTRPITSLALPSATPADGAVTAGQPIPPARPEQRSDPRQDMSSATAPPPVPSDTNGAVAADGPVTFAQTASPAMADTPSVGSSKDASLARPTPLRARLLATAPVASATVPMPAIGDAGEPAPLGAVTAPTHDRERSAGQRKRAVMASDPSLVPAPADPALIPGTAPQAAPVNQTPVNPDTPLSPFPPAATGPSHVMSPAPAQPSAAGSIGAGTSKAPPAAPPRTSGEAPAAASPPIAPVRTMATDAVASQQVAPATTEPTSVAAAATPQPEIDVGDTSALPARVEPTLEAPTAPSTPVASTPPRPRPAAAPPVRLVSGAALQALGSTAVVASSPIQVAPNSAAPVVTMATPGTAAATPVPFAASAPLPEAPSPLPARDPIVQQQAAPHPFYAPAPRPQPISAPSPVVPAANPLAAVSAAPVAIGATAPAAQAFASAIEAADRQDRFAANRGLTDSAVAAVTTAAPLAPTGGANADQPSLDMRQQGWPAAMVDHIEKLRDAADATSTRIRVVPDALGSIDVSVRRHNDGGVQVSLVADRAQTQALIAEAKPELTRLADERGTRLDVSVGGGSTGGTASFGGNADGRQPAAQPQAAPRRAPASAFRSDQPTATADDRVA